MSEGSDSNTPKVNLELTDQRKIQLLWIVLFLNLLWAPVNLMVGIAKSTGIGGVTVGLIRWNVLAVVLQLLLIFSAWFRKTTGFVKLNRRDWMFGFGIGFLMFAPAHMLYYTSLSYTSEVEGTVILTTAPIFSALFGFFLLGEQMSRYRLIAVLLSFLGAYVVSVGFSLPNLAGHTKGNLMFGGGVILECLMGALAARLSRRTSGVSVLSAQIWGSAVCFLLFCLLIPGQFRFPSGSLQNAPLLAITYLIICSGLISFTVWYRIVESAPLTLLVVGIAIQPPIATVLNWLYRGDLPSLNTYIGCGMILVALIIGFGLDHHQSKKALQR